MTAKPVVVTQQNENDAVIASGLSNSDRVVTTGFANLSDGAKVIVGKDDAAPSADLAPRKRSRAPDAKGGPAKDGQNEEVRTKTVRTGTGEASTGARGASAINSRAGRGREANSLAAQRRRSHDRNTSRIMSDFAASTQP